MLRKNQGYPGGLISAFDFCQAPFKMTFAMGRIPHAGSGHQGSYRVSTGESLIVSCGDMKVRFTLKL